MAAARLILLHINKGKTAASIKDRIDYAEDPEKTNAGELVDQRGIACRFADLCIVTFWRSNGYSNCVMKESDYYKHAHVLYGCFLSYIICLWGRRHNNTQEVPRADRRDQCFRLHAPWVNSQKEKRMIVKSLIAELQNKYHVSTAEIDEQDTHQIIVIGVAAIVPHNAMADSLMNSVEQSPASDAWSVRRWV